VQKWHKLIHIFAESDFRNLATFHDCAVRGTPTQGFKLSSGGGRLTILLLRCLEQVEYLRWADFPTDDLPNV
jgi:hypothetical protein